MNLHNSKLFGSSILNNTIENNMTATSQERRIQQSHAMFADLNKNKFQRCEEDYIKNQYMLRNFYGQENSFSKSNITDKTDLSFGLVFSPHDGLQFPNSLDENTSTRDEIFVFSVRNIAKIAHLLNLNYDKLKNLFIKIINDEEVNEELLSELNSKMSVDENVTHCEQIDRLNSENNSGKNQVFNQSTQTNEEYIHIQPSNSSHVFNQSTMNNLNYTIRNNWTSEKNLDLNHGCIQMTSPPPMLEIHETPKNINPILNSQNKINPASSVRYRSMFDKYIQPLDQFVQLDEMPSKPLLEKSISLNLSQDPANMSSQLLSVVDAVLNTHKTHKNTFLISKSNSGSPDLFSDESDEDCIAQS